MLVDVPATRRIGEVGGPVVIAQSPQRPRILAFCRPFYIASFQDNLAPFAAQYDFTLLTDGEYAGVRDTRRAFYAAMAANDVAPLLSRQQENDVIRRCRLLRNVSEEQAQCMVRAMAVALDEELEAFAPDGILCQMVDEYVTHILTLLAAKRGIRFAGYCYSYFPQHAQFTDGAYGTPYNFREPSADEVEEVLAVISERAFRQHYGQVSSYTFPKHLKWLARYRIKTSYFWLKKRILRDPLNCHYAMTPYVAERRHLRDFPRSAYFAKDWRSCLANMKEKVGDRPVLYIPLGYFPESTIDYWVPDTSALRYEQLTLEMLRILGEHFIVLAKEHLHMMGCRSRSFLEALNAIPGVISVHPLEFSNDVLAASSATILGAGSVGVEATIRGKPVFSYCKTSYWFQGSRAFALELDELENWPDDITRDLERYQPLSPEDARAFIKDCLRSTGREKPGVWRLPLVSEADMRLALEQLVQPAHAA